MNDIRRLAGYIGPYKKDMMLGALMVTIETAFELFIPIMIADLIDIGVANHDLAYIYSNGFQMGICALLALVTGLLYARFSARASYGWGAKIREAEYAKVMQYSFSNLDHFDTSSLITRMTTDVTVLQNLINSGFRPVTRGPSLLILGIGLSFWMNPKLAVVFLVCTPVLGIVLFLIVRKVAPMYTKLQGIVDRLNHVVQEGVTAIRAVKAFVRGEYEEEKFDAVNTDLSRSSEQTFRYAVLNLPAFQVVMYSAIVLIMWFGGNMILNGSLKVGDLTGFLSYVMQVVNALMMIANVFLLLTRSLASAHRIAEVLDERIVLDSPENGIQKVRDGSIDFEQVSFKYHKDAKAYALSDVDLHIEAGQTIGVIGGTGASKTTLVQMIPRLYDATCGVVKVGGVDVKAYDLHALRAAVGIILQKNELFSGTIRDNLKWGDPDADDEKIWQACRAACADEFLERLPEGLDTMLVQGGNNLSGGQKQRVVVAVAMLSDKPLILLDEPTSGLDWGSMQQVGRLMQALKAQGKTLLVITHDEELAAAWCDRVITLS